jgi:hypothetical protein
LREAGVTVTNGQYAILPRTHRNHGASFSRRIKSPSPGRKGAMKDDKTAALLL